MARNLCTQCQRPTRACICDFIYKINNIIPVLVLQHPTEVKQVKGTVALLERSFDLCQVLVGEDFTKNTELNHLLAKHSSVLLYPSKQAQVIPLNINGSYNKQQFFDNNKPPLLIILDGTWKKVYRMFMLSKNLQSLKQICLPDIVANQGQYLIRKVAKAKALSSLEATCYALSLLEGDLQKISISPTNQGIDCGCYQPLINKFVQFNQFQLSFRK